MIHVCILGVKSSVFAFLPPFSASTNNKSDPSSALPPAGSLQQLVEPYSKEIERKIIGGTMALRAVVSLGGS